jgi:hypothetical protein
MTVRNAVLISGMGALALAGCTQSAGSLPGAEATAEAQTVPMAQATAVCEPVERMPVAGRASPYDSTTVALGNAAAKICYGRPAAKGRTVFGGLVPYGKLWRTGANEPTIIHLPVAASIAGIPVEPGSYSLYTVPGEREWTVIVNRSTSQWGHESRYTPEVQAQEVGRATVAAERTEAPVESFTIRAVPAGGNASNLLLEWENARVRVPVARR